MDTPGANYLSLFFIFFILLSFFFYIFYRNPYYILNFARIPMMLLCMVVVLGFFIFIEYYMSHDIFKSDTSKEVWINFSKYLVKYGYYLFYLLMISFVGYIVYKGIEKSIMLSFSLSFSVTIGLLILLLTLLNAYTKQVSFNNPHFELLKNIIMYIPCLITDMIEFIKKDYTDTPSTVFIVFICLVVYVIVFYVIPFYQKNQYKNEGIFLLDKSLPLNTDVLSITSEALNEKIQDKRPFYDKWFQQILDIQMNSRPSTIKLQKTADASLNLSILPDAITLPYYLPKIENFTSIQNEDSRAIPWQLLEKRMKEYDNSAKNAYSPEDLKKRMIQFVKDHPQILTVLEKAQYLHSVFFASWDTVRSIPHLWFGNKEKVHQYSYHYAITSWIYLHQIEDTKVQRIYSFGTRPSIYFDPVDSSLMIALNYGKPEQQILYKTSSILYQRWNFIVMNYRYGSLDIFINNNLVGTYPDVLTKLDPHDILIVGSSENKNIGGICNMKYYELPISVRKINDIYKTFHNKKIPV